SAFDSGSFGNLGRLVEGTWQIHLRRSRKSPLFSWREVSRGKGMAALHRATMGEGPESLQMLTSHSTGLVIEGMGGGHLPDGVAAVAREAAAHIPIVLASRTGDGYVLEQSYGFSGGEMDLLA